MKYSWYTKIRCEQKMTPLGIMFLYKNQHFVYSQLFYRNVFRENINV